MPFRDPHVLDVQQASDLSAGAATFTLDYDVRRTTRVLVAVAVGFALVSLIRGALAVGGVIGPDRGGMFDVNSENSVSTWYQGVQMFLASLLLWSVSRERRRRQDRWANHWLLLCAGFAYLSLDELISIHEKLTRVSDVLPKEGIFYYGWIVVALPVLLIVATYFLSFLKELPAATRRGFVIGAIIYVTGAVLLEAVGGEIISHYHNTNNWPYLLESTVEELLEPLGIIVFLDTLARHVLWSRRDVVRPRHLDLDHG